MNNNRLLKALMLEDFDQERRDKAEKEMDAKLQKYMDNYNKRNRLLKALQ